MPEADVSIGVFAFGIAGLTEVMSDLGQPRFRAEQVARWIYERNVREYAEMTDLPAELREQLASDLPLARPSISQRQVSRLDGTIKYLVRMADGVEVETVALPTADRLTVCFSTQAGCAMGCAFCATGQGGFVRDLYPGEMAEQVHLAALDLDSRVSNAVAMGQGEPLANYDRTLEGLRLINSPVGLGIGARHITISTCGLVQGIERLAEEPEQFTLAISLHSAIQSTRDRLMPGLARTGLGELRDAITEYTGQTHRRVSLEYALIDGVNDSGDEIGALIEFASGLLCHVNLIPANPVEETGLGRSARERSRAFVRALSEAGIAVSVREERGADIDAACGQLKQRTTAGE
jgi:23S rRNA (adenine2503-C2)-methyltransferase